MINSKSNKEDVELLIKDYRENKANLKGSNSHDSIGRSTLCEFARIAFHDKVTRVIPLVCAAIGAISCFVDSSDKPLQNFIQHYILSVGTLLAIVSLAVFLFLIKFIQLCVEYNRGFISEVIAGVKYTVKKEDYIMINTLMLIAANTPKTGDTFPRGIIFVIIIAAVILAVGTAVFAKKKGGNDDEDDDE